MTIQAAQDVSLGFIPGDHVCAFYSSSRNVLDDIVVDYITKGLQAGNVFIRNMETMAQEAADEGYGSFRAVGDESFLIRNDVDIKEWFAAESEWHYQRQSALPGRAACWLADAVNGIPRPGR
jgi:hypothetical protein